MKLKLRPVPILGVVVFLCGSWRVFADPGANSLSATNTLPQRVQWHTIKLKPKEGFQKIHFYEKLNPVWWFQNRDEPTPPKSYKPDDRHRKLKWSFRNPMHNFNNYVIGVADKKIARSGRFPERDSDPRGGWDFEVSRYKFIWFPFISYHRPKFDFYFGWRDRGNFGIKFNINPDRSTRKSSPSTEPASKRGNSAASGPSPRKKSVWLPAGCPG